MDVLVYYIEDGKIFSTLLREEVKINNFITAALAISRVLGIDGELLFDDRVKIILKLVTYFSFYIDEVLYVPMDLPGGEIIDPIDRDILETRYSLAKAHNFSDFGLADLYAEPDFLIFNCMDYHPMNGVIEALYGGFFIKGREKWNHYFVPRLQFPSEAVLKSAKGVIITGSRYCSYQSYPWLDQLKHILSSFINHGKIVGICFGHQIVAKAFGGETGRNPSNKYMYGPETIKGTSSFTIMQSHGDCVVRVPEGFEVVYSSASCLVEALKYQDKVLTFQGHPEYTEDFVKDFHSKVMKSRGVLGDGEYDLIQGLNGVIDSVFILELINRFLRSFS